MIPPRACDCHLHVYDPRFPYVDGAVLRPAPATVEQYRALQARLGLTRAVVVQPSSYGADNRCTLDAVRQLGVHARAVVAATEHTTDQELLQMHESGARGVRFNLARGAPIDLASIASIGARIAPLGWHLQLHAPSAFYAESQRFLEGLAVPIVIDHLARVPMPGGLLDAGFLTVCKLLRSGKVWVKLSGAYFESAIGSPSYADAGEVVRAYSTIAPSRLVWGTDWPHPSATAGERPVPDDAVLLDRLCEWLDPARRAQVLVENPAALYGF